MQLLLLITLQLCGLVYKAQSVKIRAVTVPIGQGENPFWDDKKQVLYFTDAQQRTAHKYNPKNGRLDGVFLEGGILLTSIPTNIDKWFIATSGLDLILYKWDGVSILPERRKVLTSVEKDTPRNLLSGGKADVSGRLWIGTRVPVFPFVTVNNTNNASLYSFDARDNFKPKLQLNDVTVSNGLAWNKDSTLLYYIDSFTRRLDVFDFDLRKASISNRRTAFDFAAYGIEGFPDGMTIDNKGNLWVAVIGNGAVYNIDPYNGAVLNTIQFPTVNATGCAFGGKDLATLYVTTSRRGLTDDQISDQQQSGALFEVTGLGVTGQKSNFARIPQDFYLIQDQIGGYFRPPQNNNNNNYNNNNNNNNYNNS